MPKFVEIPHVSLCNLGNFTISYKREQKTQLTLIDMVRELSVSFSMPIQLALVVCS